MAVLGSFWFCLPELPLVIFESWQVPASTRCFLCVFAFASCSSMVIASLLLPELLSLLGWWGLLWCGRSPETQALLWGKGNNVGGEAGCTGASTVSSAIRFTELTSANKEGPEYRITGASVAGKIRSQAPLLLLPPSYLWWWAPVRSLPKVRVMWLLPLLLLGSLKLWAQLPQSDNWDCRHQLRCSLVPSPLCVPVHHLWMYRGVEFFSILSC